MTIDLEKSETLQEHSGTLMEDTFKYETTADSRMFVDVVATVGCTKYQSLKL